MMDKLTSEYYIDETAAEAIQMILKKARILAPDVPHTTRLKFAESVVRQLATDLENA